MKKIYLSFSGLLLCGSVFSQNAFNVQPRALEKAIIDSKTNIHLSSNSNPDRTGTAFRSWVEPVGQVMAVKGITEPPTANPNQTFYLYPIFMDSTVREGSGTLTNAYVANILLGSVLDPKSTNLKTSHLPIVTKLDAYNIDSLAIVGSYIKKTASIDTLYTWLVWGDTTNTAVFSKVLNNVWGPPVDTWRHSLIGPVVTGASTAQGNKIKAGAPSSNCILVKRALTNSDSVGAFGHARNIKIQLPTVAVIPAGNIVSCFFTYVPGGTHVNGDCIFSSPGSTVTQNINGFAAITWGQKNPAVTSWANYVNQQVDPSSWCMGASYGSDVRYNQYPTTYSTFIAGDLVTSPIISYSIYGNTTTGISKLENNSFALGQNIPNPATNLTTINYQINKAAATMALEIYDIRGVKMFEKTQTGLQQGNYSVELNSANYPAGIYFYSLTVDGNKITKKMIVAK